MATQVTAKGDVIQTMAVEIMEPAGKLCVCVLFYLCVCVCVSSNSPYIEQTNLSNKFSFFLPLLIALPEVIDDTFSGDRAMIY